MHTPASLDTLISTAIAFLSVAIGSTFYFQYLFSKLADAQKEAADAQRQAAKALKDLAEAVARIEQKMPKP